MRKLRISPILAAAAATAGLSTGAAAQTVVSANITTDTTWNLAGSPAPKIADRTTIRVAPGRNAEYMKFVQALLGPGQERMLVHLDLGSVGDADVTVRFRIARE